ncbi:MAG: hypothetical protein WAQ27_01425 [Candidatus Microsaccharimonas sp.]
MWHAVANKSADSSGTAQKPAFQPVLPLGKSIEELGGWERVSPPENDPVYAFTDSINGVSINVSQQELPKTFVGNVDSKVAEVAKNYNATTEFKAGDTKVYIGTSAQGPQSVIFIKDNLLVLIKSQKKIEQDAWKEYIQSLTSIINAKY